ncbi:hypothetical protein VP01_76g17, partial [Puccinia sorghi]
LSNTKSFLNTLHASERSLSLNFHNPAFLEMAKLTCIMEIWNVNSPNDIAQRIPEQINPGVYDEGIAYHPECYYQIPPPISSTLLFDTLAESFPDKGGDTAIMQKVCPSFFP